jgi:hypothetical protein
MHCQLLISTMPATIRTVAPITIATVIGRPRGAADSTAGRSTMPRRPIESTFATVRLRTKVTKGPGSRGAGIAMAYKLIDAAQAHWRAVNAPHLIALVRAGAVFHKGQAP